MGTGRDTAVRRDPAYATWRGAAETIRKLRSTSGIRTVFKGCGEVRMETLTVKRIRRNILRSLKIYL